MLEKTQQSNDLSRLAKDHYIHPFSDPSQIRAKGGSTIITHADRNHVFLQDGTRLLDAMAGLWCVHIGYNRPEMVEAIAEQTARLPYASNFTGYAPDVTVELAVKLAEIAPESINSFFFGGSGSDCNDTIYKFARYYWKLKGKPEKKLFLTRDFAYHGSAGASSSLTGIPAMQAPWGYPIPAINHHVKGVYKFRDGRNLTERDYGLLCAQALEDKILAVGANNIAAFLAEPIYGASGIITPPEGYWQEVNRICEKYDILLCADEVICGFGRTGDWFGSQTYGIKPDFITMAKGLTSGYIPMGAVGMSDRVAHAFRNEGGHMPHGYTYSGHPVAAAAALKNIEILQSENLVGKVKDDLGPYLQKCWSELADHPLVGETRGIGSLAALEIVENKGTMAPFAAEQKQAYRAQAHCLDHGVIMRAMGNVLYCAPPFTINHDDVDQICAVTRSALDSLIA